MFRLRNLYLVLGSALVLGALFYTDPDGGLSTGMLVLGLLAYMLAALAYYLAPYIANSND